MKNLSPLQKKYEVAVLQNWIAEQQYNHIENLVNSYLTEAPATPTTPGQPVQQTQPQNIQQAVQQIPKQQLPSLIDQLVGQIAKTNPQAFAELQTAVQSNNVNAINQLIKKYSTQAPVKETTIEEVIIDECVKFAYVNRDFVTIQKLHEFVRSGGDAKIITEHISNNCTPDDIIEAYQELYSEAVGDYLKGLGKAAVSNIGKGIKTVGKGLATGLGSMFGRLGKFVGKYGPWAALGAVAGGPIGAAAVPLIKAALNKYSGGVGLGGAATTDKDKKTDTTTPQQVQQPVQQDKKPVQQQVQPAQQEPAQQQPVQPAQQEPIQPAQQQPAQPAQQQPVQPAQQEPIQPAQQQPVQQAQQANVNVVPPDATVAAVPTTTPTEPPVVDIDAKDITPGPTATPVSSAAVVPATDTRLRRARPMKTVTPIEPPKTINEFQSAFQKAINEFKRLSAESPIEKANRK